MVCRLGRCLGIKEGLLGPVPATPAQPLTESRPSQGREGELIKKQIDISFYEAKECAQKRDRNELAFCLSTSEEQNKPGFVLQFFVLVAH